MKTVVLSAGHFLKDSQNRDPGVVYNGLEEWKLTIAITQKCFDILKKHGLGVLTVPDDLDLDQTIQWINDRAGVNAINVAVEIHINKAANPNDAEGVEGWYYHSDAQSQLLTWCMIDGVNAEAGMGKRAAKDEFDTGRFTKLGFVHDTIPLASLIEVGFIDSDFDRSLYSSDEGLFKIAKGVARGILTFLGEAWKPELLVTTVPVEDPLITEMKNNYLKVTKKLEQIKQIVNS